MSSSRNFWNEPNKIECIFASVAIYCEKNDTERASCLALIYGPAPSLRPARRAA